MAEQLPIQLNPRAMMAEIFFSLEDGFDLAFSARWCASKLGRKVNKSCESNCDMHVSPRVKTTFVAHE